MSSKVAAVTVEPAFRRIAVVVHPSRPVDRALATLTRWASEHAVELVQLADHGAAERRIAAPAEVEPYDLVVALGGDGTVLNALRASAAAHTPVLGVACGSLGALSAVTADEIAGALDRTWAGDWTPRSLPALAIAVAEATADWAVNDFVVIRRGSGQLAATVGVDGEQYVRLAGDGLIVATALGSSAYSMAAGGPILAADTAGVRLHPAGDARRQRSTARPPGRRDADRRRVPRLHRLRRRDRRPSRHAARRALRDHARRRQGDPGQPSARPAAASPACGAGG